jgi:hypothetical protein
MKHFLYLIYSVLLFTACNKEQMDDCFTATGNEIKETRQLEFFTELEVRGDFNLVLVEDSVNFIKLEAGSKLMEQLKTEVEFQRLLIENTNTCNWVRSYKKPKNLELHCNALERITLNGTTNLSNKDTLRQDTLRIKLFSNNGVIHLNVANQQLTIEQPSGAAELSANGRTGVLIFNPGDRVSGNFLNLNALRVEAESRSEIDCYVKASESLRLITRAGGSLLFTGDAEEIEKASFGEGSVSRIY